MTFDPDEMPSAEFFSQYLDYNPETGEFRWRRSTARQSSRAVAGQIAGNVSVHGYLRIAVRGRRYSAHHIAWIMVNGSVPPGMEIDHINRNRSDCRISNLRLATHSQNCANKSYANRGLKGTTRVKNKWQAQICRGGKKYHLGRFSSEEDAHQAYARAATKLFGKFASLP